jgi:outer membrane lipoprotein-sorting protein
MLSAPADELAPFRVALEKQAKHRTVSVSIRQTKRIPALSEAVVESGHLWLEPGKAFRWQIGNPVVRTAMFNGSKVHILDELQKTGIEMDVDDRRAKPLLLMLGFGEAASLEQMLKSFTVASTNQIGDQFAVSLRPKDRLRRVLKSMHLQINTRTSFVERIEWTQRDGTVVLTEFLPPVFNKPLPAEGFSINSDAYSWE